MRQENQEEEVAWDDESDKKKTKRERKTNVK